MIDKMGPSTKEAKFEKKEIKQKFDIKKDNKEEIRNIWNENKIEELELLESIGHGAESRVYKAQVSKNKKFVTIKMIIYKEGQKKNTNEIRISNKLRHKNIINIYGVKEIIKDKIDSIVMEYAKQGNLRNFQDKLLKKSYLSESLLCYLTYQILCGLKYCHMNKVVHFDIKPQNIVIDDYLAVKIIDFSVALDYSKIKSKSIKLPYRGTTLYMAQK
jgi:serine/threonine protein kinase